MVPDGPVHERQVIAQSNGVLVAGNSTLRIRRRARLSGPSLVWPGCRQRRDDLTPVAWTSALRAVGA